MYLKKKRDESGQIKTLHVYRRTPHIWGDIPDLVFDLMIHDFDTACLLMGMPKKISAAGLKNSKGLWGQAAALLQYENSLAVIEGNSFMPNSYPFTAGYTAVLEEETVEFTGIFKGASADLNCILYREEKEPESIDLKGKDPYTGEMHYLIDCLKTGSKPELLSGDRALSAIVTAEKVRTLLN